ncbi:MAG: glutamylcysteine synthetase, partial [Ruminococcus sp.]|nr:glutamylcysteine synthetase [Ruminococcus sp.]
YFHEYPEFGTFSSASQVQLDVEYDKLPLTINTFTKLEPIKALLFNNSVLIGEHDELHCCRDMFWENSTHGINSHNIGMFECEIESTDDLLNYISSTSIYCVERGDKYINFVPMNIVEYMSQPEIEGEYYKNGEYKKYTFKPELDDISYLRTFKFEDLTFRGTIEFRSVCCQPISDCMSVAAFHAGLMNKLDELTRILENDTVLYHNGYTPRELRKLFVQSKLPEFIDKDELYSLTKKIVNLSAKGLSERGLGEEKFLEPLFERISSRSNPAKELYRKLDSGESLENIIRTYALI